MDPSLALVIGSALTVAFVAYRIAGKRTLSLTGEPSQIRAITTIDAKLLRGAVIFGIGWGLVDLCPAPAIVRIGFIDGGATLFVLAMGLGMKLCDAFFGLRDPSEDVR